MNDYVILRRRGTPRLYKRILTSTYVIKQPGEPAGIASLRRKRHDPDKPETRKDQLFLMNRIVNAASGSPRPSHE